MKHGRLITIGSFDGVHLGHRALLERTRLEAKKRHLKSLALTFSIPPKMILDPVHALRLLSDEREKEKLIRSFGIDEVHFWKFTKEISMLKPFTFLKKVLIEGLKAKGIVVGASFRFGAGRSAGVHELVRWGLDFEVPVWVIAPVKRGGNVISSSMIRHLLETHRLRQATGFLGHPYLIAGRVVRGRRIGRQLGFRTANLQTSPGKVLPRGVFVVRAWLEGRPQAIYSGVCNIGVRPTLVKHGAVSVEAHLFNLNRELVGKTLFVELRHFLRAEKKFHSPQKLQRQIGLDVKRAKRLLGGANR